MKKSFIDLCVHGKETVTNVDNYVKKWRTEPTQQELNEYLGMTEDEFEEWLKDDAVLWKIVQSRIPQPYSGLFQFLSGLGVLLLSALATVGLFSFMIYFLKPFYGEKSAILICYIVMAFIGFILAIVAIKKKY